MTVHQKLLEVQATLKVPKRQYNSFGKYKYRSCEDILEAVKPLLKDAGLFLKFDDETVEREGKDGSKSRVYVKTTATIIDVETGEQETATAQAREDESKKGMDGSQITGTASSYARKYCLNGLFLIDDTKDADTDEYSRQTQNKRPDKAKVSEGGHVRFFNDNECQILSSNGNWYNVEQLPTDKLIKIADKPEFAKARSAITAVIHGREVTP